MILLLIFLYLKSGQLDIRTSVVYNTEHQDDFAEGVCQNAMPLVIKLYREGKFADGPPAKELRKVTGRCEPVEDSFKLTSR